MPRATFILPDEMDAALLKRGDRSTVLRQVIENYFYMLDRARTGLRERFSAEECALILDACNGTISDRWSTPLLWAGVQDAIRMDALDTKWRVDGGSLVEKLKGLDMAESFALADAVRRWWNDVGEGREREHGDLLR